MSAKGHSLPVSTRPSDQPEDRADGLLKLRQLARMAAWRMVGQVGARREQHLAPGEKRRAHCRVARLQRLVDPCAFPGHEHVGTGKQFWVLALLKQPPEPAARLLVIARPALVEEAERLARQT